MFLSSYRQVEGEGGGGVGQMTDSSEWWNEDSLHGRGLIPLVNDGQRLWMVCLQHLAEQRSQNPIYFLTKSLKGSAFDMDDRSEVASNLRPQTNKAALGPLHSHRGLQTKDKESLSSQICVFHRSQVHEKAICIIQWRWRALSFGGKEWVWTWLLFGCCSHLLEVE